MSNEEKKKPSFHIFAVRDSEDGKAYFNRIGTAFPHGDGKGHSLDPWAFPAPGSRLVIREPEERIQELKDKPRDGDNRNGDRRDDKRSREERPPRDTAPRYER